MGNKRVIVGMSGGVDSSVSALLLKQQGYDVTGLFMKNWEEDDDSQLCSSKKDYDDVARVCDQIDIPYYSVNFAKEYKERVFNQFVEEYRQGYTPNPDVLCNREIKFNVFFKKAIEQMGADYLATGHYCQNNDALLQRGKDPSKDQTYFLYTIKAKELSKVIFPIGHLLKSQVREIALQHNLATSTKKDSTGICFIGKRDFKDFLSNYLPLTPGKFETANGQVIGQHDGIAYYTIGQRKGLKIGGAGQAWFVVGKDVERNVVIVEQGEDHPLLYHKYLTANEVSWINKEPTLPLRCSAKIRYRAADAPCVIESSAKGSLVVTFDEPQKAITPRQSVVFYDEETCLGGAMIDKPFNDIKELCLN
ncbi:MAG: tRNA 2-thiouridine(34) synthase MnmA [Parachlamydiales bacterium]|nr:tRNA 2-thiouridine(34) synthase MnmA [Parachlamydiales bacterium]